MIKQLQMRQRMKLEPGPDPEKCCWCEKRVGEEGPLWHVVTGTPFSLEPAGTEVELEIFTGKKIVAYVRDAPLWNLLFRVCTGRCAHELAVALDQDNEALRETWTEGLP